MYGHPKGVGLSDTKDDLPGEVSPTPENPDVVVVGDREVQGSLHP